MKGSLRDFVRQSWIGFLLFAGYFGILTFMRPNHKAYHPESYVNTNCSGYIDTDSKLIELLFSPEEFGWPLENCDLDQEDVLYTDVALDGVRITATVFHNPSTSHGRGRTLIDVRGAMQSLWIFPNADSARWVYADSNKRNPSWLTTLPVEQWVENASFECRRIPSNLNQCVVFMQHDRYLTLGHIYIDEGVVTTEDWYKLLQIMQQKLVDAVNSELSDS